MQHQFPNTSPTLTPVVQTSAPMQLVRTRRIVPHVAPMPPTESLPPVSHLRPSSSMVPRVVMAPRAIIPSRPAANLTSPAPNITHAGPQNLYVPEPLTDLSLNHLFVSTLSVGDISANSISTEILTIDGVPYAPASTWYQYPVPNGQAIHFIDICGNHILHAIDGDLYYDFELLAKAGDIQDVADWSLYPALQNVDMDGHALENVSAIDLSGTAITASDGTIFADGVALATVPALLDLSENIFPTLNLHTSQIAALQAQVLDISGSQATWSLYPAISNVDISGYNIGNVGSLTAGGAANSITLGTSGTPMNAISAHAQNVEVRAHGAGTSLTLQSDNGVDIRSYNTNVDVVADNGTVAISGDDVNIFVNSSTSTLDMASDGAFNLRADLAGAVSAGLALVMTAGLNASLNGATASINAVGAANVTAGGAISIAAGDYVEVNAGSLDVVNTTSGQGLLKVNNISGAIGDTEFLSLGGGSGKIFLSTDVESFNHDITGVQALRAYDFITRSDGGTPMKLSNFTENYLKLTDEANVFTDLALAGTLYNNATQRVAGAADHRLTMTDPSGTEIIAYLSDVGEWSTRPAVSTVQMAGYDISGAGIVYAAEVRLPGPGNSLTEFAGCTALQSGDALYLQPQGTVIVQDIAGGSPAEGSLTAGYLQATTQLQAPSMLVNGPTDIKLSAPSSNILDITDTGGAYQQARMAALNLNSGGGDLALFKQSSTRLATTDGITDRTIAYLSDLPTPSALPAASFSSTANQVVTAANTATIISHNTVEYNSGDFSLDISGNIVVDVSGVFEIIPSIQFNTDTGGSHIGYFWLRINNTDVANSTTAITVTNTNDATVGTVSLMVELNVGDVVKVVMASATPTWQADANPSQASPYVRPANPSIITTIKKLISSTASVGGPLLGGGSGASVSMTQHILSVPAGTANMAATTTTLGPVLGGAAYSVVGQNLTLSGSLTQTGVAMPNVYTWNDGTHWYLDAHLTNCSSSLTETWTINVQKSSTAILTNTIAAP
jgi:hypothetical protein